MPAPDASSIWQRNYPNAVNSLYHTDHRIISIKALRSQNFSGLKLRSPLSNAHVPNMIYFVLQHIIMMQIVSILARANSGAFRIFHTNHYILFHHSITKQGTKPGSKYRFKSAPTSGLFCCRKSSEAVRKMNCAAFGQDRLHVRFVFFQIKSDQRGVNNESIQFISFLCLLNIGARNI